MQPFSAVVSALVTFTAGRSPDCGAGARMGGSYRAPFSYCNGLPHLSL